MVRAVIVAAGAGRRIGTATPKVLLQLGGKPALWHVLTAFERCEDIEGICLVSTLEIISLARGWRFSKLRWWTQGGDTRGESVLKGLTSLPDDTTVVAIHDGARPLIDQETILSTIRGVAPGVGVLAGYGVRDTIQQVDGEGFIISTPDRSTLKAVQTPQTFCYGEILSAYRQAQEQGLSLTDDGAIYRAWGGRVRIGETSASNLKLTLPEDITMAQQLFSKKDELRIGTGYDVHRLAEGRTLVLGGVTIDYHMGLVGHSDADVAVHAIMDALLGAAALPDIGHLFPDDDGAYLGIYSIELLRRVGQELSSRGIAVINIDCTIVCQRPKIMPYRPQMIANIATALDLTQERVNIKATTSEGLGFEGEGKGISAQAVALISRV